MPRNNAFNEYSVDYDNWYTENQNIYTSELNAIKNFISLGLYGVEIGVGTGRFAKPLDIGIGVEPSDNMAQIAQSHGIKTVKGTAECLPLSDKVFDFVLMVTAICFFNDVEKAFQEAHRVLKDNGFIVVAFIDKESELGQLYEKNKHNNHFYKDATFYSVREVIDFLAQVGFSQFEFKQTIYNPKNIPHEVKDGYGSGGFVVVKALKSVG